MIQLLHAVFFQWIFARLNGICINNRFKLIPLSNKSWALSENAYIINLFSPFICILFLFCVSQIESGLSWRHKFGNIRTIIMMRFSLAGHFVFVWCLFLTVNFQILVNFSNNFYEYSMVQSWYLIGKNNCKNPSPVTFNREKKQNKKVFRLKRKTLKIDKSNMLPLETGHIKLCLVNESQINTVCLK